MTLILSGMTVYAEAGVIPCGEVILEKDKIKSIGAATKTVSEVNVLNFPANYSLVPGFIDLHVHGAQGADVMDASLDALSTMSQALASEGTTSFLATTMTAEASQIENALANVQQFMQKTTSGAACLGVHLEGPFISKEKLGAQHPTHLQNPEVALFKKWQALSGEAIKLVTLAPELPHIQEMIAHLNRDHVVASIGHTNASYEATCEAIQAGCTHATHIFNAMSGIQHRSPGAVTAALLAETVFAEMIVDGVHLHPAIVALLMKVKTPEKLLLVTDAMRAKCLCDGIYDLGGQSVHVKHNEARLENGVLAGSVLKMSDAIKNVMKFSNCSLEDVIKMSSANPAKVLKIFSHTGSIAANKAADLVVLDDELNVVMTICQGKVVWQCEKLAVSLDS